MRATRLHTAPFLVVALCAAKPAPPPDTAARLGVTLPEAPSAPAIPHTIAEAWIRASGEVAQSMETILAGPPPDQRLRVMADIAAPALALHGALRGAETSGAFLGVAPNGERGFELAFPRTIDESAAPPRPPLMIRLTSQAAWIGRTPSTGISLMVASGPERQAQLAGLVAADRVVHPKDDLAELIVDDDVTVADTVALVAATQAAGYIHTWIREPEAPANITVPEPEAFHGSPDVPTHVTAEPTGRFQLEGLAYGEVEPGEILGFWESCEGQVCTLAAARSDSPPLIIGQRTRSSDPTSAWIFGKAVWTIPAIEVGELPVLDGAPLTALPRIEGPDEPTPMDETGHPLVYVRPGLPKEVVSEHIAAYRDTLRRCYLKALLEKPELIGTVVIRAVVVADGSVAQVEVKESTLGDPAVEACVVDVFKGMRFPEPEDGTTVTVAYPLKFEPPT